MEEVLLLLENYWILRERDPENYYRIKDKEQELRPFLKEKLGYNLVINPYLVRMVKIPGEPKTWMGVSSFLAPLDYSFLFLILSFLEDKGAEDQFVLSELTEYVVTMFPGDEEIDWTFYQKRRSLVRVLQYMREMGLIKINDGSEQGFSDRGEGEVLYESSGLSRYFLPSFSGDITALGEAEEFLNQEWGDLAEDRGVIRRHRVYRRLLLSPMVYAKGPDDPDFQYIRTYRHILERDFNQWLQADFQLHRSGALLVLGEKRFLKESFPQGNNLSDIVLSLAGLLRKGVSQGRWQPRSDGSIIMIEADFNGLLTQCKQKFSKAWFKTYREKPLDKLAMEVLEHLESWEMARRDPLLRTVTFYSLVAKLVGEYPGDFIEQETEQEGKLA